jgi:hypothetical protein
MFARNLYNKRATGFVAMGARAFGGGGGGESPNRIPVISASLAIPRSSVMDNNINPAKHTHDRSKEKP